MTVIACTVLVLAVLLIVGWRAERVVREKLALEARKVALQEAAASQQPKVSAEIPPGLLAIAESETEPWARDHVTRRMRELYVELRDWNRVGDAIAEELGK